MAKIKTNLPKSPMWPWGGPRSVRERLIDPSQFERKRPKRLGDPKRPALASNALLEFIGPGHTSDELRLPPPPSPFGGAEEITPFPDRTFTREVVNRSSESNRLAMDVALNRVVASPDKLDRMRAVLAKESQMLELLGRVQADTDEIIERMSDAFKINGSY